MSKEATKNKINGLKSRLKSNIQTITTYACKKKYNLNNGCNKSLVVIL